MTKTKLTIYISKELADRTRNTVAALQGRPLYLTLAEMAERAFTVENERLEREHNNGEPFSAQGKIKTGRPLGS